MEALAATVVMVLEDLADLSNDDLDVPATAHLRGNEVSSQVTQLYPVDPHFGLCPQCRRHDGFVNIGADHWVICRHHKCRWFAGSGLFSGGDEATPIERAFRVVESYDVPVEIVDTWRPATVGEAGPAPF